MHAHTHTHTHTQSHTHTHTERQTNAHTHTCKNKKDYTHMQNKKDYTFMHTHVHVASVLPERSPDPPHEHKPAGRLAPCATGVERERRVRNAFCSKHGSDEPDEASVEIFVSGLAGQEYLQYSRANGIYIVRRHKSKSGGKNQQRSDVFACRMSAEKGVCYKLFAELCFISFLFYVCGYTWL